MNPADISKLVSALRDSLVGPLRDEVLRDVDGRIMAYRRAVWVREDWCCNDMRRFALEVWGASHPARDSRDLGTVGYSIRGLQLNYCPFCGVSIGVDKPHVP